MFCHVSFLDFGKLPLTVAFLFGGVAADVVSVREERHWGCTSVAFRPFYWNPREEIDVTLGPNAHTHVYTCGYVVSWNNIFMRVVIELFSVLHPVTFSFFFFSLLFNVHHNLQSGSHNLLVSHPLINLKYFCAMVGHMFSCLFFAYSALMCKSLCYQTCLNLILYVPDSLLIFV